MNIRRWTLISIWFSNVLYIWGVPLGVSYNIVLEHRFEVDITRVWIISNYKRIIFKLK